MATHRKITKKKSHKKEKNQDKMYEIIPLLFIAGIIPLVIYIKKLVLNDPGNMYWDGVDTHFDVFSYYKMVLLLVSSSIGLLIYLFMNKRIPFDTQKKAYYIPMGVYLLFILLSAVFSEYRIVAFNGFRDRYEGAFVLMAYVVIMYLAANVLKEEKSIKILFLCLLGSAFVISILGALQLFELDYFKADFINSLIIPEAIKKQNITLRTNFPAKTIFSTLYNPNYIGSYMAMLFPIVLIFLIWVKKTSHRLILVALLCLIILNAVGCESRAGIVGIAASIIVMLIMFRKNILRHKKAAIAVVVLLCGGLVIMNYTTNGMVLNSIKRMASLEVKGVASDSINALEEALKGLNDISVDSEKTIIITEKGTFQMQISDSKLKITDENEKEVVSSLVNNVVSFKDNRFQNIKLIVKPEEGLIEIHYNEYHLIDIIITKDGLKSVSNRWMTYRDNRNIETFGFTGNETFGSSRGYIWSRSIPLLKDTILLGNGPDTFPLYFPQYDYLGKLKAYEEKGGIFVDKPHNIYLQTAMNTGIISLLALLAIFGMYFISSIKIYIKEEFTTFRSIAGLACFAAFCGYAAAGMFNDSVVSVAPVFWVLLGMGIGINIMLKEKMSVADIVKHNTMKMGKV